MAETLQIIVQDAEHRAIQKAAPSRHLSVAEWVREALRLSCQREGLSEPGKKLDAIRAAARNSYPVADIEHCWGESKAATGNDSRRRYCLIWR